MLDDAENSSDYLELNVKNVSHDAFGVGRILYPNQVQFQDVKSMTFASFSTFFTFSVNSSSNNLTRDGLAFILWLTILAHLVIFIVDRLAF